MNEEDKLIEEQLKTLPPNLQQAINAVPWKAFVQEIGKTNVLDSEQIISLEQETMFVLYAFENPTDFVSNIIREVGVTNEVAETIAESIADKILDPILERSEGGGNESAKNLPMVEEGEVAHDVPARTTEVVQSGGPHVEQTTDNRQPTTSVPDYRYPNDKDPYREPLQ